NDVAMAMYTNRKVATGAAGQAVNFENVKGGAGNDTILGNAAANSLLGGLGNDTIFGGDGNDLLVGGVGNDVLDGQAGIDSVIPQADAANAYRDEVLPHAQLGIVGLETLPGHISNGAGEDIVTFTLEGANQAPAISPIAPQTVAHGGDNLFVPVSGND